MIGTEDAAQWSGTIIIVAFFLMVTVLGWSHAKYGGCDCETEEETEPEPENGSGN